ncbi:recombinase family protein [uncultured Boseongicola sp.]|uniref:recombinase family protein n=1 Tax=uncultured Boseongicola sp. TaxID=1648499 RepID=UPI00262D00C2|nr:recombinase family protein [uncultured Boseongicola sp.]
MTAERIRDKVAASKRKGMWIGGTIPLGYDVIDKALVVDPDEAAAVRTIFAEYRAQGSVRLLSVRLRALGIVSKRRTNRFGHVSGGTSFSRGALYNILRNPIYIGKVRHKDALHEGLQGAIINDATWKRVQTQLADHGGKKISSTRRSAKRLLDGILFDTKGRAMRTTYASKSIRADGSTRTKRYWYYTTEVRGSEDKSEIERLPADEIERVVMSGLKERLNDTRWLVSQTKGHKSQASLAVNLQAIEKLGLDKERTEGDGLGQPFTDIIDRIDAYRGRLVVSLNFAALAKPEAAHTPIPAIFEIPFQRRQNGCAKPIIIAAENAPQEDQDLIALIADARRWAGELLEGKAITVQQITEREGLRSGCVSRILPLAWLAPDISTAILEGRQPPHLTAKTLRALPELPLDWAEQRRVLGFAQL